MKNDTAEAALGLLNLSSHIASLPHAVVPLKQNMEKGEEVAKHVRELDGREDREQDRDTTEEEREREVVVVAKKAGKGRGKGKEKEKVVEDTADSDNPDDSIRCICGYKDDDGLSMACDGCQRWVHCACFGIVSKENVPDVWKCWECHPRPVDKSKAIKTQRARQRMFKLQETQNLLNAADDPQHNQQQQHRQSRKVSPGVERKPRRAIDGSGNTKRKRRISVSTHNLPPANEDEQIDIDEPAAHDYIHVDMDIVPQKHTRDKLRRMAHSWRGATALDSPSPAASPVVLAPDDPIPGPSSHTSLRALPPSTFSNPTLSPNTNPSVRPPSYAVHTTQPIPSDGYIAPYTSTIVPSSQYLSDPLNSYAHLGMPKPFVHLVGPPLDVALDARLTGRESRYVRNGCRPNAVLRPVVCPPKHNRKRKKPPRTPATDETTTEEEDAETLSFAVFALRDLKANEEVVLGWEWDDGSVIHQLPALIENPHYFAPYRVQQLRSQMTSMLHALSSNFTTCACGNKTRDCALTRLAEFVDHPTLPSIHVPIPLSSSTSASASCDFRTTREHDKESETEGKVDLGPLVGKKRGFRTREKIPMSGGMSGVEMVDASGGEEAGPSTLAVPERRLPGEKAKGGKGKGKATTADDEMDVDSEVVDRPRRQRRSDTPPPRPLHSNASVLVPPRLRKGWIRERAQGLRRSPSPSPMVVGEETRHAGREQQEGEVHNGGVDTDSLIMPPTPLPPSVQHPHLPSPEDSSPAARSPTSPTAPFAKLSLISPAMRGPSSYFATALHPPIPSEPQFLPLNVPTPPEPPPISESVPQTAMQIDEPSPSAPETEQELTVLGEPFQRRSSPRTLPPSTSQDPGPRGEVPGFFPDSPSGVVPDASPPRIASWTPPMGLPWGCDTTPEQGSPSLPEWGSPVQDHGWGSLPSPHTPTDDDSELLSTLEASHSPSPTPREPTPPPVRDPTPPPAPPPKKKISMGDYLSRKREAEKTVSPAVSVKPLVEEPVSRVAPEKPLVEEPAELKPDVPNSEPGPPANQTMDVDTSSRPLTPPLPPPPPRVVRGFDFFKAKQPLGGRSLNAKTTTTPPPPPSLQPATSTSTETDKTMATGTDTTEKKSAVPDSTPQLPEVRVDVAKTAESGSPVRDERSTKEPVRAEEQSRHETKRVFSTIPVTPYQHELQRQQSQEDGEIFSPPPPKAPPLAPRSLLSHASASSSNLPTQSFRQVPPPAQSYRGPSPSSQPYHYNSNNTRPLPRAPRALRNVANGSTLPPPPPSLSTYNHTSPIRPPPPRGPSADRRDWDNRDSRARSGTGNGWHGSR
ncbi:hypothetical protein BXZ70DRAFT_951930 [Cristinia sonorae]|uniref:PHD-type domain-containing protein n=1 Tax=Cristinia sonorae TaxID=1940300 RepID=A0A8K0UHN1_9AGAR|nr:hypothetical protein BXZ70DRAFT_951930 [Cristinia sonorae]